MTRGIFVGGLIVSLLGAPSVVAGQSSIVDRQSSIVVHGPSKTAQRRPPIADRRSTMDDRSALLAKAVQQLERPTIQRLLQQRIDVNAPQVDGTTALHWAAYHDDLELVKRLLDAGAGVGASNRYGMTPLSLACTNGNVAMAERFLDAGADANSSLPGGESVLMTAARTGSVGIVRALIARGADVHAREARGGQTALIWAAAEGHVGVLEELIKAGGDFRTPLASGFTPLLFAVREGRIGAVKALLKAGANVNEVVQVRVEPKLPEEQKPVRAGTTPLHLAIANAHFELAAGLLDAGADPNADQLGYTVLHALVKARNPGIGDNVPGPQGSGTMTSLELVTRLVAHGAKVNARMTRRPNLTNTRFNELGATPFLLAAVTADAELMRALVAVGADPSLTNGERSTALMAAAGLGTRSPGEDAGTEEEVLEALQLLLELGADINAVDDHGETAMHGAAYKNLPRAVKFLADKGAKIDVWNTPNDNGWRPLTIARGYRFGNFKPSAVTVAAIEHVMLSAGITPLTEKEEQAKGFDIYAPEPPRPPAR
jgi:ankyrin repeat protein